ncbi:GTPase IMAP family member 4-like [Mytilus trossulus]|uniref:GTPase IMAP family member 4-like n=1 Tax=Mytilus trossulus TaxID=6551 RepID=UPI003004C961
MRDDILKFLTMTSPGPHIIILALETSFATELESYDAMLEPFIEVFGKNIVHYVALVLDKKQKSSIPDMFDSSPICGNLVKKDRLIYFEQQKRNQLVFDILQIVRQIRTETMEPYFSNDFYAKTEYVLKQKCLEQLDSQLEEVRRQEPEIASLKEKLSILEERQNIITDLNTRESAIKHFDISLLKQIFNREIDKETSTCEIL